MKRFLIPRATLGFLADSPGQEPSKQGYAEEDHHAAGDVPRGRIDAGLVQAQPARQYRQVEPAEAGEGDHLEHRVDRHQNGGGLPVTAGQVIPDNDHGYAAGQADDDQASAVSRQIRQENPGQGEHQRRTDHPVQQQRTHQQPPVTGHRVKTVVADLGQHRVHHHQQPDRNRQADAVDLHRLQNCL